LGTAGYGVFSYAITLAGFITLFMDPGVNSILMRDAAKSGAEEQRQIFSTMFLLKLCLLVIGVGVVTLIAPLFSTLPGARAILPIVAIVLALDTVREFFTSLLRAQERMQWDAGIFLLTNLGILIFGFTFLALRTTPGALAWGYVAGDVLGIALATFVIRDYFRKFLSHVSLWRIGPILNAAWPFAITGALGTLLTSADILIISWMKTSSDVGIYSAVIRIIQVLYLIPVVIQYSALPLFARLAHKDNPGFRAVFERIVGVIFVASVPLAVGGAILGAEIMHLVFGAAYLGGGLSFRILIVGMMFDFPTVVISSAIFAYNHQRSLIITSIIGGATNVLFDLLLIPRFGITGSAVATLIAQILSNWYLWHIMNKLNPFTVIPKLGNVALAGIAMGIAVGILFLARANVVLCVAAGGIVYLGALALLREPLLLEAKRIASPKATR
jgi:O-antigen/teichoic acid export membrane protein